MFIHIKGEYKNIYEECAKKMKPVLKKFCYQQRLKHMPEQLVLVSPSSSYSFHPIKIRYTHFSTRILPYIHSSCVLFSLALTHYSLFTSHTQHYQERERECVGNPLAMQSESLKAQF